MEKASDDAGRWDAVAGQFNDLRVPSWDEDLFLKLISDLPVWGESCEVMDLGCGAGRYSIAVSERCAHVTGSDVSAGMIAFAEKKKEEYSRDNITFVNENWHDIDIDERGYRGRFDLVFGHMTPAMDTTENIKKATDASKGYCALATFAKRTAPMADKFYDFIKTETPWKCDRKRISDIFAYLYDNGYFPKVLYYVRDDTQQFDEEGAVDFLVKRFELDNSFKADEETVEKIREFVGNNMEDGVFVNPVEAVIVTIVWSAKKTVENMPAYVR